MIGSEAAEAGQEPADRNDERTDQGAGAERDRRWLVGGWVLGLAIVTRIMTLVWSARIWFFTNDDWDYLTRTGVMSILDPHRKHLTGIAAGAARVVRRFAGLDFWPAYPIVISLSWPLVGLAAWWYWRRRNVDPIVATGAAILLVWLAAATWIQFGHIGAGVSAAALIIAIHFDTRRLGTRNLLLGAAVSLIAVFASTIAVLGTIVRLVLAATHRKWNGVVTAGVAAFSWGLWRLAFGTPQDFSFRLGDLPDIFRVIFLTVGGGLRLVIPWPESAEWVLGLLFVVAAIAVVVVGRFRYEPMVFVGTTAAYLLTTSVTRFIDLPANRDALFRSGLNLNTVTTPRFANIAFVLVLVAGVGLLGGRVLGSRSRVWVMVVLLALGAFNIGNTLTGFDRVAKKSVPLASLVRGYVELVEDGEPGVNARGAIDSRLPPQMTREAIAGIVDSGDATSLRASDIYRDVSIPEAPVEELRGALRIDVDPSGTLRGSWPRLGLPRIDGCLPIEAGDAFSVTGKVVMRLERSAPGEVTLTWIDEWGEGTVLIDEAVWSQGGEAVYVNLLDPDRGGLSPQLVIDGPGLVMCMA